MITVLRLDKSVCSLNYLHMPFKPCLPLFAFVPVCLRKINIVCHHKLCRAWIRTQPTLWSTSTDMSGLSRWQKTATINELNICQPVPK